LVFVQPHRNDTALDLKGPIGVGVVDQKPEWKIEDGGSRVEDG
jgi:hypothetical protein